MTMMEARSLFRLPQSYRGCLRAKATPFNGFRRHESSSSRAPSTRDGTASPTNLPGETPSLQTESPETTHPAASNPQLGGTLGNPMPTPTPTTTPSPQPNRSTTEPSPIRSMLSSWQKDNAMRRPGTGADSSNLAQYTLDELPRLQEHHLHIYATRHNCHMTLSAPSEVTSSGVKRNALISLSSGNIGFRKAARGSYDAAFQLGSYMMSRIQNQGLLGQIQRLEVVLRGFGPGREAVQKILLGVEGANIRNRVVRVTDATRVKFGGSRSRKPRRLG